MSFGEKLLQLRKEQGLSQEALAEKLNTTRQAVSKWENDQGYPEMEKLLMIGNIFNVSMDFLLKNTEEPIPEDHNGYYVSQEMAEGFLNQSRKSAKFFSFGVFFVTLAFIPYFLFGEDPRSYLLPTIILGTIGVSLLASTSYLEEDTYKVLKREKLMFDTKYFQLLNKRFEQTKKKGMWLNSIGFVFFISGVLPIGLTKKGILEPSFITPYYPICLVLLSLGAMALMYYQSIIDAYKLLAKNEQYVQRFSFRLRKKLNKKFDDF